jgi:hypothetical protein
MVLVIILIVIGWGFIFIGDDPFHAEEFVLEFGDARLSVIFSFRL